MSEASNEGEDVEMLETIQWRQYANFGSSGVGASGSMRSMVKDWEDGDGVGEEIEIVGCWLTWLTRARLPSTGDRDGKLMARLTRGVKLSGMIFEGRRFALSSEERRVVAMVASIVNFVSLGGTALRLVSSSGALVVVIYQVRCSVYICSQVHAMVMIGGLMVVYSLGAPLLTWPRRMRYGFRMYSQMLAYVKHIEALLRK